MNLYQQFINDTDDETDIRTELTLWEKDVIIESMQIEFNMTQSQAVVVYNFWEQNKDTLYGKAKGLERLDYDILDKTNLEEEEGFKIFLFQFL